MGILDRALHFFKPKPASLSRNALNLAMSAEAELNFDGLNPLLAKQLSELEAQIGQLAQVQFELSQERSRMRFEMDALKKSVQESQVPAPKIGIEKAQDQFSNSKQS